MMVFARIATKNRKNWPYSLRTTIFSAVALLITLGVLWYWMKPEAPTGRLRAVSQMSVAGANGLKAMAASPDGKLYIADSRNNRVVVLDGDGNRVRQISNKTIMGKIKMANPVAVAVSQKKLWVGCYSNKQVLVFNRIGKLLDVLPHQDEQAGLRSIAPLAMTADQAGNLYVADGEKGSITVFDDSGKITLVFGSQGFAENKFSHINGLAVDEKRQRLIIQDSGNNRLVFTTLTGQFLSQTVYTDKGQPLFTAPRGLAYNDSSGVIYVADALSDIVFALDEHGRIIASSKEKLSYPQAVALGENGFLFVANREDKTVIKMNP